MKCPICKKSDKVVTRLDGPYCLDCGRAVLGPSDATTCSALQQALDDGQEVKIFKIMGAGRGYCAVIHGDCYLEARSRDTLEQAIADVAKLYQEWDDEAE